jgi:hypothetical protein
LKGLSGEQHESGGGGGEGDGGGNTANTAISSPPTSPIRNKKKQNAVVTQQQTKPQSNHKRHLSSDINQYLSSTDYTEGLNTNERQNHFRQTFAFSNDDTGKDHDQNNNIKKYDDKNGNKKNDVQQLSDLLRLFVQLKESAGVERAILSSLLAFRNNSVIQDDNKSNSSLPSFRMLTNDLILEVENQRALCHKLHQLPSGPHHTLVLELAELSPRLKELQEIILTNFSSLQGAEYDYETIWDIITMYIDKLHSIELLIIEDLDLACAEEGIKTNSYKPGTTKKSSFKKASLSTKTSSSSSSSSEDHKDHSTTSVVYRALEQIGSPKDAGTSHELLAEDIKKMPADQLKDRVLALLSSNRSSSPTPSVASGKEICPRNASKSIPANLESTAAENLNLDMNNALRKPLERAASKEWEISIYEIKFQKRLGQGASATTYLGKWTGQNVAVKVASITEFGLEGWRTEVNALQRLHHPNIIRLMGSIYNENPQTHCLVLEYCNGGDLSTALRYPTPRNFFFHVSSSIANAMSYLHKRGMF